MRSILLTAVFVIAAFGWRALDRIDEGAFGLCERCGQRIDRGQVFAGPDRLTCAACAASRSQDSLSAPSTLEPSLT
jgi:RNA polymerase-binding transcription factor DksA